MGGNQSTHRPEEEQRRKVEHVRTQRPIKQEERRRIEQLQNTGHSQQQEEQIWRRKQQEERELEGRQRVEQEERNEKARQDKQEEFKYLQELASIENLEKDKMRKDDLAEKELKLEHERLMYAQEKMFSILTDTFSKVKPMNMTEAALVACVMQSVTGKPVDKDVLNLISAKLPVLPPTELVEEIIDNIVRTREVEENDGEFNDRRSIVSRHDVCRANISSPEIVN